MPITIHTFLARCDHYHDIVIMYTQFILKTYETIFDDDFSQEWEERVILCSIIIVCTLLHYIWQSHAAGY